MNPSELQYGWDVAAGDVEPGWVIVYAGHTLWHPQRVLKVEIIDADWQRVWTLGDASTRHVWDTSTEEGQRFYDWDNGFSSDWSFDEMGWPHWDDGPWWPLQPEPLSEDARRFVLDSFGIAVECPECGAFGQPIIFGLVIDSRPHVTLGGCCITGDDPDYACECGAQWSVTDQGAIHVPHDPSSWVLAFAPDNDEGSEDSSAEVVQPALNYEFGDVHPYGEASADFFAELQATLVDAAGGVHEVFEGVEFDPEIYVHYWGRDRYSAEMEEILLVDSWDCDQ